MRPDLPWNVAGIPAEAREAARAAARREGLSTGEWLTRRILAGLSDMSDPPVREEWRRRTEYSAESGLRSEERASSQRDSEAMLDRVARTESAAADVYRRIEEQLRNVGRRLDASERSQSETNREMSKAATEMNIAAREQAQAFDQLGSHVMGLSERLDRVERRDTADGLRDAVKALHQGMSRLADQVSETASQSATQISALAGNLENVAARVGQARHDTASSAQALEHAITTLDERVRMVERAAQATASSLDRALATLDARHAGVANDSAAAIARLEDSVQRLESRGSDPALDRRLSGIERTLDDVMARVEPDEAPSRVEESLRRIAQRLDALESAQRDTTQELRKAAQPQRNEEPPPAAPQNTPFNPAPVFEAQPFPGATNQPPFVNTQPPFVSPQPPFSGAQQPFSSAQPPPPMFSQPSDPGFVPPPAYDAAMGAERSYPPGQEFAQDTFTQTPTVDSYLSAARRSARAASQAEADRDGGPYSGFGWGGSAPKSAKRSGRTRPLIIGIGALIAIALIAGAILNRHSASDVIPGSATGTIFDKSSPPVADHGTQPAAPSAAAPSEDQSPEAQQSGADEQSDESEQPPPQAAKRVPERTVTAPSLPRVTHETPAASPPPRREASLPRTATPVVAAPPPMTALDRLTALANAGNAKAELVVGLRYLEGDGVPANEREAAKWLGKSAEAGEPVAQYRLGTLYERGRGVAADPTVADRWYLAAANQGNRKAMHNLAVAYAEGSGVKKDYAEASRWFAKAANLGLSDSQFNLAVLYERGLGVPQSLIDAYRWYAIAAAQGDAESKARIGALSTQLSADDRAAAQRAADSFRPTPLDARANVAPTMTELTRR